MIPKIIHYCWLSEDPIPSNLQKCMDSWKRIMPDYEIKLWSANFFDVDSVPLVKQAYEAKKWAFAADYIRLYALYTEGGIYLDSDVMLYKDLSKLFNDYSFVSAVEYNPRIEDCMYHKQILDSNYNRISDKIRVQGIGIQAAILCAEPAQPLIKDCLYFYDKISLSEILSNEYIAPTVLAYHAEKYGYRYIDEVQLLSKNICLYSSQTLSNFNQKSKLSYAVHYCAGSWTEKTLRKRITNFLDKKSKLYRIIRNFIKGLIYNIK